MLTLLLFIVILALLVFVHEAGHFAAAHLMGMKVEEFGFGFPPRAWSRRSQKDGVLYSVNWIPLGGFVKIKGEDGESASSDPDSFSAKKPWQRFIVLIAGVAMNFALCAALFTIGYIVGLPQSVSADQVAAGRVRDHQIQVVSVIDQGPAASAGFRQGDAVISIDGAPVTSIEQVTSATASASGRQLQFTVRAAGEDRPIAVTPGVISGGTTGIGVGLVETGIIAYPWYQAPYYGVRTSVQLGGQILAAFGHLVKSLLLGNGTQGLDVSGPVGIAVLTGEVARLGFIYLLQFTALLSLNLAIINILPFPALDGGRIVFVLAEKLVGRPVDRKVEGIIHTVGFSILMLLIMVVTFRDLIQYSDFFKSFWHAIIR